MDSYFSKKCEGVLGILKCLYHTDMCCRISNKVDKYIKSLLFEMESMQFDVLLEYYTKSLVNPV